MSVWVLLELELHRQPRHHSLFTGLHPDFPICVFLICTAVRKPLIEALDEGSMDRRHHN